MVRKRFSSSILLAGFLSDCKRVFGCLKGKCFCKKAMINGVFKGMIYGPVAPMVRAVDSNSMCEGSNPSWLDFLLNQVIQIR